MDERTLNDLLECSVCLERLDTTSKVLPCQHTFCRKCLEVIVASHSELRCPECRILVDIKIDDLPPNVLLMRILGGMKSTATAGSEPSSTTTTPLQMHRQQASASATTVGNLKITNLNLNGISSEHGAGGVNAYIRDQVKRANAAAQNADQQRPTTGATAAAVTATEATTTAANNAINASAKPNSTTIIPAAIDDNTQHGQRSIQATLAHQAARQPLQALPSTVNSNNSQQQQQQQSNNTTSPASIPHAKALYDFESKEPGDLHFKKGDRIVLRRRIDVNWFVGECNGREGVFPLNYVQIIVPLAQPQCKALYDFRMGPNEEEGCLTFKKGAIINVLRRVDHNWAEGRIDDTIGIFPISFCEMNPLAKLLMDASSKYIHYAMQQRNVPPTPSDQPSQQQNHHHQQQQQQLNSFSNSSSSSQTTSPVSPNSSSTTSTSSNSGPMIPIKANGNQLTAQNVAMMTNASSAGGNKREALHATATNTVNHSSNNRHAPKEMPASDKSRAQSSQKQQKLYSNSMSGSKSSSNSKSNQRQQRQNSQSCTSVPSNAYVALFPYKPQKSDELELKKGSIYYVKERCQDGWFRGVNRSQKTGVFPGNYVTQLRALNEQSNGQSASGATGAASGLLGHSKRSPHGSNAGGGATNITVLSKSGNQNPPDLPPRSSGSSSSTSSTSTSVWSKPIGQHVEAIFGRSQSSSTVNLIKRITNIKRSKSPVQQSTPAYSMDNPVFEDNTIGANDCSANTQQQQTNSSAGSAAAKRNTIHLSHPQHVRSGSCPSQLLQSLPVDINVSLSAGTSGALNKADMFGSHRIRPHKERAALQQMTNQSFGAAGQLKPADNASSPYHRKSQSLDAATIAAQLTNGASDANKRKSYAHNEKFKCIVSYPPNSDFELELSVGDIVYVHKKRDNGWYKGTHAQTGKVGLFPSSFVEPVI